jgi:hypothetical protein
MVEAATAPRRQRTLALVIALTLLALALRVAFLTGAEVAVPVRGDIREYWYYAWNLVEHGVFSVAAPGPEPPVPDAWRAPGYPAFLAACLWLAGGAGAAVALAQWLQVLLGTALVPLTFALGRRWLAPGWALAAGALVAVWPHLVVFASTLLSETLFAFALLFAAWLAAIAQSRDDATAALGAGVAAALATLVNPLLALFPPVVAALLGVRGQRRVALAFLLGFALVTGAWAARNAAVGAGAQGRMETNLVQGSWPLFLQSLNDRSFEPIADRYFRQVDAQVREMHADPVGTLGRIGERLRSAPGPYARWYLLDKPWMLWSWRVRVGWGDVYFLQTRRSPFERYPAMRALRAACLALNPLVAALALAGTLVAVVRFARRRWPPGSAASAPDFAWMHAALLLAYVTALHAVLQGEPRQAVAYRPLEFLVAVSALAAGAAWWRRRRSRSAAP